MENILDSRIILALLNHARAKHDIPLKVTEGMTAEGKAI